MKMPPAGLAGRAKTLIPTDEQLENEVISVIPPSFGISMPYQKPKPRKHSRKP